MCLTIPYQVKCPKGEKFVIMANGQEKDVISPLFKIKKGDWVLTQNNIVVKKITSKQAKKILDLFD